ncbi:MAG: acetylornithine deacetylase [Alphaproteobacteria bacterium]|nr:acetylornithine deacetylase [Alphaproteobacteria bacterium]
MTDISAQRRWIERLVAYDTTSSKTNLPLIDDVEAYLKDAGAKTFRVYNDEGDKANLYAVVGPMTEGGVVLSGHTDVVPVEGQAWATDPFKVVEKDGKLYGRGTADMKSFSAIALSLVPEMTKADLKRPIIFALSYDEEIGLFGAPRMIAEIRRNVPAPHAVIVGEPTMMKVIEGHKGIASFKTTVTGFTTHSSQTDRGVSAVEAAAKLIVKLAAMREARAARADPDCPFTPPYTTVTVNVVEGGTQVNIMAGACSFRWDCRSIPGDSAAAALAEFSEYAKAVEAEMRARAPSCRIVTEQITNAPPLGRGADTAAADLAKSLTGLNSTGFVSYATEAGQFQDADFSVVVCGPGSIDQAHQADEFISLEQVEAATVFMRKLIARLKS